MHMPTNHGHDKDAQADKEQLAAVRVAVDEVDDAEVRAPGRVERVIEHVRKAAEKKDIDPDIVEKTYRAMITAFTELELKVHKANS
jgi:isochorismate pyruvate lyase